MKTTTAKDEVSGAYVTVQVLKEYTYELSHEVFRDYALRCGILRLAGAPDSQEWHFVANHQATQAEFNEHFRHICFDDNELRIQWSVIVLIRGLLQFAWEEWSLDLPF